MRSEKKTYETESRVQFRSTLEEKAYLERGATICGFKNLSEFLRVSAHEKLRKDCPELEAVRIRQLSERDSVLLAEKLINPPEPNEKLKALFSKDSKKQIQK
jgi:uncharacterized protein (DUF1778 family)